MAQAKRTSLINAPIDRVWPVLADFAGNDRWSPPVFKSFAVNGKTTGLAARRRCELNDSGSKWTEEQIIAFDESNHRYTLQIVEGTAKPPLDDVRVELAASPRGTNATQVTMTADLTARGPMQKVTAGVGAIVLKRVFGQLMAGLEYYIATGRKVTDREQVERADP
jgi:carbon monoxide dehydrogenase subunit G